MIPNTPEAWRNAIIEHRVKEIRSSMERRDGGLIKWSRTWSVFSEVKQWMLPGILDAAVRE